MLSHSCRNAQILTIHASRFPVQLLPSITAAVLSVVSTIQHIIHRGVIVSSEKQKQKKTGDFATKLLPSPCAVRRGKGGKKGQKVRGVTSAGG